MVRPNVDSIHIGHKDGFCKTPRSSRKFLANCLRDVPDRKLTFLDTLGVILAGGARLEVMANAGHFPHWEQPEAFVEHLSHFADVH